MLSAICVVGKGDSFGIHARVYPVSNAAGLSLPGGEAGSIAFPGHVATAIRERWAPLVSQVIPADIGLHLLKVSRHRDNKSGVWTWIGYYQFTEFDGEDRGGHYFGVGIAFCEALVSGDVGGFLDYHLDRLMETTFRGPRMARSIFKDSVCIAANDVVDRLDFQILPQRFDGINPEATMGVYQQESSWTAPDVERMVKESLQNSGQEKIAGRFFGNWAATPTNSNFYMADSARTARAESATPATYSAGKQVKVTRSEPSSSGSAGSNLSNFETDPDNFNKLGQRLEMLDRKVTDLAKRIHQMPSAEDGLSRRKSTFNLFQWMIVILLSVLILIQASLVLRQLLLG